MTGLTDHIIPWENAHRSIELLGGTPRVVLFSSCQRSDELTPASKRLGGGQFEARATAPGSFVHAS